MRIIKKWFDIICIIIIKEMIMFMIMYMIICFLFLMIAYLINELKLIVKRKNNQILYYKNIA
jgi:hypothetical protein